MNHSRREVLSLLGKTLLAPYILSSCHLDKLISNQFAGRVLGLGKVYKGGTVLNSLDLSNFKLSSTKLDFNNGHSVLELPTQAVACVAHKDNKCVIVDQNNKVISTIVSPENHDFGGHGMLFDNDKYIMLPAHRKDANINSKDGIILVVDSKTFKIVDQVSSGGIHPHEIRKIPGRNELIATDYGLIKSPKMPKDSKFTLNIKDPKVIIYDSKTLQKKREFLIEPNFAMLTHMDVGNDGMVYAVMNQYWPNTKAGNKNAKEYLKTDNFHFTDYERDLQKRLAIPLPILRIDPVTGKQKKFFLGNESQRISQSIINHKGTGRIFATYVATNKLVIIEPNGKVIELNTEKLGITGLSGVSAISGTDFIAINGRKKNIALLNAKSLKVEKFLETQKWGTVEHIHYINS